MAQRRSRRKPAVAAALPRVHVPPRWHPPPSYRYHEPTESLTAEQALSWSLVRIVRRPPKGMTPKEHAQWIRSTAEQGFTASTRWLVVPGSDNGHVRRDKVQAIHALKPRATWELVRPRTGFAYLRVSWQAATGRQAWLSLLLERPPRTEVVEVARGAGSPASSARAARLAALQAEGEADEDEAGAYRAEAAE